MSARIRVPSRTAFCLIGVVAVAAALAGTAGADMLIRLKDGRVLTVPVDQEEIGSIAWGAGTDERPAAKRAADRIRDDAEEVRSATDAASKAGRAAERAEQAARIAAEAAAQAKAAFSEARAAAEAAKRVAHTPPESSDLPHPDRPPAPQPPSVGPAAPPTAKPAAPPGLRLPGIATPDLPGPVVGEAPARRILTVGEGRTYALPSLAAQAARDGDTIEIAAGTYRGDVAVWRADNLLIRGVGGRVVLDADGKSAEEKATWVIKGRNTTVRNIAFTGSRVPHMNGAGIRLEGPGLVVRDCEFHDNQMGILTGENPDSDILIERSRFYRNTTDYPRSGRLGHNIYIGKVRSFTLRFSQVMGAEYGHNVKSRARRNVIAYNMIADGADGRSSYLIDLPSGGVSSIVGNVLKKSARAENPAMISFGAEEPEADEALYVAHNTFVNEKDGAIFVQRRTAGPTWVGNNILAGGGTVLSGRGKVAGNLIVAEGHRGRTRPTTGALAGNLVASSAGFADAGKMDFRLTGSSPAIDAAAPLPDAEGGDLTPLFHFVPPTGGTQRPVDGRLDIGAFEYRGE